MPPPGSLAGWHRASLTLRLTPDTAWHAQFLWAVQLALWVRLALGGVGVNVTWCAEWPGHITQAILPLLRVGCKGRGLLQCKVCRRCALALEGLHGSTKVAVWCTG